MTATLDEQVLDLMVTKLGTITVANGYQTEIGASKVHRITGPREFAASELPAITLKRLAASSSRFHIRGAQEEILRVRVRGMVAAASPDEFDQASALMGDILDLVEANLAWNNGSSDLAERTWIEERRMHDPAVKSAIHVCSVVVAVLIRVDRTSPTVRKVV